MNHNRYRRVGLYYMFLSDGLQILSSSNLARLLKRMLLIGNAMNRGSSRKEEVSGFTLDSLLKIINMKGMHMTSPHLTAAPVVVAAAATTAARHSIESPHTVDALI